MHTARIGKTLNYSFAYTLSSAIPKGIGFLMFMYFASIMSVNEYAKFGINYSVFAIIGAFASAGIVESVISFLQSNKDSDKRLRLFKTANSVFFVMSIFISIAIIVGSGIIYHSNDNIFRSAIYIILSGILSAFFVFQSTIIRLEEKHLLSISYTFIPSIISYIFGFSFVYVFRDGDSFFLGSLLGFIFSIPILKVLFSNFFNGIHINKLEIHSILSRTPPYIAIAGIGWILGYGNSFLIDAIFDKSQVATYIFLYTIASILQLVSSSLNQVWSPAFFSNYNPNNIQEQERKYIKVTTIQGLIIGLTGATILLLFPIAVEIFPKLEHYKGNQLELFLLFSGYLVTLPWIHIQNYYIINNKGRQLMNNTILSGLIGLTIWVLTMMFGGSIGIYVGFFTQALTRSIIVFYASKKHWNLRFDLPGLLLGIIPLLGALLFSYF